MRDNYIYVNVGNGFSKVVFNNICGMLRQGKIVEPMVSCIGHNLNNMVQEDYKRELENEFGAQLETTYREGVCSYGYFYKLKKNLDDYEKEVMVFMAMQFYEKFVKGKPLLLDVYYDLIKDITKDYMLNCDNRNMSLLKSVNEYLDNNRQRLEGFVNSCIDY